MSEIILTNVSNRSTPASGKAKLHASTDGKVIFKAVGDDGNYATNLVAHFCSNQSGAFTMANSASAQSPFAAANDVITLPASTTYIMEGLVQITGMGATTRTTALVFGGTATLTSISYFAEITTGAAQTITTIFGAKHCIAATAQVLNATVATAAATIFWKGIVRINGTGTFIPQVQFSADPTGTILCSVDSWFMLMPIGTNTTASAGSWA